MFSSDFDTWRIGVWVEATLLLMSMSAVAPRRPSSIGPDDGIKECNLYAASLVCELEAVRL